MSKHTPGPWKVGGVTAHRVNAGKVCIVDRTGPTIKMGASAGKGTEEGRANAYLVAAAPELLEACRQTLASWNEGKSDSLPFSTVRLLKAAIAAAEGRDK